MHLVRTSAFLAPSPPISPPFSLCGARRLKLLIPGPPYLGCLQAPRRRDCSIQWSNQTLSNMRWKSLHLPHRLPNLHFPERMRRFEEMLPPKPSCGGETEVDGPEKDSYNVRGWFRSGVPPDHSFRGKWDRTPAPGPTLTTRHQPMEDNGTVLGDEIPSSAKEGISINPAMPEPLQQKRLQR